MLWLVVLNMIAGIGIFMTGFKLFTKSVQELVSHRLRNLIQKHTNNSFSVFLIGLVSGFLLQDTDVIVCVIGSLYAIKALDLKKSILLLFSSNFSSSLLLYVLFIDIKPIVLFTLGLTGYAYYLEKPAKMQQISTALLSLCLMLFAIFFIEESSSAMLQIPWLVQAISEPAVNNPFLFFLLSTVIIVITHSELPIYVITADLFAKNILPPEAAMLTIYGIYFGCGISSMSLGLGLRGASRRIFVAQLVFDCCIPLLFLPLYFLEKKLGVNWMEDLFFKNSFSPEIQIVNLIVAVTFAAAILGYLFIDPLMRMIEKLSSNEEEESSLLMYLNEKFTSDLESAAELIEKENIELTKRISPYFEWRLRNLDGTLPQLIGKHELFQKLTSDVEKFCNELASSNFSASASKYFLTMQSNFYHIVDMEETVYMICSTQFHSDFSEYSRNIFIQILESQHALLCTLTEALTSQSKEDWDIVKKIANPDNPIYEEIRKTFSGRDKERAEEEKKTIFELLHYILKLTWLITHLQPHKK